MSGIIRTAAGATKIEFEFTIDQTPIAILNDLYEEQPDAVRHLFDSQTAVDQLQDGIVDDRSQITLLTPSGEGLRCDWRVPLCEDPAIKSALSEVEASGDTPVFAVTVLAVVA